MGVYYASREDVMQALDIKVAAYSSGQIDRAIDSASRKVESLTNHVFYPTLATRYFDFPNVQTARAGRLWLDENELISLTTLVSGGQTLPANAIFLEPVNSGPPYRSINLNRGLNYALQGGPLTPQQAIAITGVWGYQNDEKPEGTLAVAITTTAATTITMSGANVGVGRLLHIDAERMIVTDKSFITSAQTVLTPLTANLNNTTVAVTDGTQFVRREQLIVDAETMLVMDIAGNNLIVKRAQQGSVLAAHAGSTVFYARQLTVTRGVLGTTAATHLIGAPVVRHAYPPLVEELTIAYTLGRELGESSGYAREIGAGSGQQSGPTARSIASVETDIQRALGRYRQYAV
jgi:hypothetical protein